MYDDAGNILTKRITEFNDDDFDSSITKIQYGYTNTEWGDLLTSYDGTDITYDGIGNPLSYYNGTAYTFSWCGRQLTEAIVQGIRYTYTYNDEGIM